MVCPGVTIIQSVQYLSGKGEAAPLIFILFCILDNDPHRALFFVLERDLFLDSVRGSRAFELLENSSLIPLKLRDFPP